MRVIIFDARKAAIALALRELFCQAVLRGRDLVSLRVARASTVYEPDEQHKAPYGQILLMVVK